MDPVSKQQFSHDAVKYVYQDNPNAQVVNQPQPITKPFKVSAPDRSTKAKKDVKKQKREEGKISPYDLMGDL